MTSVIFGASSSPCTALYIKNRNAEEFADQYPEAAHAIKHNHYMDDYLQSFPSIEEAEKVTKAVDTVHRKAGFELRGWMSNKETIVRNFKTEEGASMVEIGGSEIEKTLGLLWDVTEDKMAFRLNKRKTPPEVFENRRPPTKREALSIIMSLFDPLGLASPLLILGKRIMQETWRYGTGWDEPLPAELQPKWTEWLTNIQHLTSLRIPRCYDYEPPADIQMHTFVDASEEAYAAAVYLRFERADGTVHVALAAAKSRVTPLKPTSIPRLELQAALLGARLADTTAQEHEFRVGRRTFWSDSRTALAWIRAEPRAFKTFVAHRLAEIEESTKKNEWRWLPSSENVADDATRSPPMNFNERHRWFRGPEFLRRDERFWPSEEKTEIPKTGEEREKQKSVAEKLSHAHLPDIDRFSRWGKLIRATARIIQFLEQIRRHKPTVAATQRKRTQKNEDRDPDWRGARKKTKITPPQLRPPDTARTRYLTLDAGHLIKAERLWIIASQRDSFPETKTHVKTEKNPHGTNRLAAWRTYIDSDGTLRLKGRTAAAVGINEETINPAILDGKHKYTRMYIQHVHEKLHHGGTDIVVNELQQRFSIVKIRPAVREVIKSCVICRMRKAKPAQPSTGDLPTARVAHHERPFSFTGLDYFGPLEVTVARHREKRYVALFTCLTTRAIHLEVAASLSTDSAITALRRFIARRGCPTEIWSDNVTCFTAANRELREAILEAVSSEATNHHIRWGFIPPASPFMGGAWERMVRSVKEALRTTLHEQYPSDETLVTLLAEVENTINSRPLTHVRIDVGDPVALTPNTILIGPNCHSPAPGHFNDSDLTARHQWRRAQRLADLFWQRWVKEYLPMLQHRREPHSSGVVPKIGDLVIICDPNLPRNTWPRGRVSRVFPGPDGEVRVVDITTAKGHTLRRPMKKIVVLPIGSRDATAGEMCTTNSISFNYTCYCK